MKKNKDKKAHELSKELEMILASSLEIRRIGILLMSVLIMLFIAVVIL